MTPFLGALDDPRPLSERARDYRAEELATFAPVPWTEKSQAQWRKFPIQDQDGSGSCVAQTAAKLLSIDNFLEEKIYIPFSPRDIYTRRQNFASAGMFGVDALGIASNKGATYESLMPSHQKNEVQMNDVSDRKPSYEQVGLIYRAGGYVQPAINIETIASVISTGKGVMVWFYFKMDEWTNNPTVLYPALKKEDPDSIRHSVTATDFTLYQGKKALIIDDSWGLGFALNGQRIITEEFFNARCYFTGYLMDLSNNWRDGQIPPKPKYTFNNNLKYGNMNIDVKALQDVLKYEQLFPQATTSTGFYGNVTATGVLAFQKKYQVDSPAVLDALAGKEVGPKTRTKLNQLYAN